VSSLHGAGGARSPAIVVASLALILVILPVEPGHNRNHSANDGWAIRVWLFSIGVLLKHKRGRNLFKIAEKQQYEASDYEPIVNSNARGKLDFHGGQI
jgi:hypothetical protein